MAVDARIQRLATLFLPSVRLVVAPPETDDDGEGWVLVEALRASEAAPERLTDGDFALLVVPESGAVAPSAAAVRALVGVETRDVRMAQVVAQLLHPAHVAIELAHIARLSSITTSPTGGEGLDNPRPLDLLMYEGARDALITIGDDLRAVGFSVNTRLREGRDAGAALEALADALAPALIVLGRGRHGSGPGRRLLERGLPVLYAPARG